MSDSSSRSPGAYRAAAVRLREAIEWNRFDAKFRRHSVESPAGRLIAVMDANVVDFFMDPASKLFLLDVFRTREEAADTDQHDLLTFARITAEFLFLSDSVRVGEEDRQLWREPPLLAPGHAEEVEGILRSIEAKGRRIFRQAGNTTEANARGEGGKDVEQRVTEFADIAAAGDPGSPGSIATDPLRHRVAEMVNSLGGLFARPDETDADHLTALLECPSENFSSH